MKEKLINGSMLAIAIAIFFITTHACNSDPYYFRSNYENVNELLHETKNLSTKPYLKAHLKNGNVSVFKDTWHIDSSNHTVSGKGVSYDFNRFKTFEGDLSIKIDSVAIFETNKKLEKNSAIGGLTMLAGLDIVFTIICLSNPKTCFGSCPTFYFNENDNFHYSDAEGFSNAISPSLEYSDIDALNNTAIKSSTFSLTMKNEALETHCINEIKILAFPRKLGERIYHTRNDEFYQCQNSYPLTSAKAQEGDVTVLLRDFDRKERFSLADDKKLNTKEEIFLSFDNVQNSKNLGVVIGYRQTLMTTYFIYSAIGYMGDEVGDIFAKMENSAELKNKFKEGIYSELGNIDVYIWNSKRKKWEIAGYCYETGPIALNHQIIQLSNTYNTANIKLKIVINKGLWRIDYVTLTNILEKVRPIEISPSNFLNKGVLDTTAITLLERSDKKYLISMPGDNYKLNFSLPTQNEDYELFLCSKGYYLEWMRTRWIKNKNLIKLKQMVDNPKSYLEEEVKDYKSYEMMMEQEFWNSRTYAKSLSYYEK